MNVRQNRRYEQKQNAIASVTQKKMLNEASWIQWFKEKTINKKRHYEMTAFDAFELMCRGCYYCGDIALGIDRLDSDKGHIVENCVACCSSCNRSKSAIDPKTFVLQAVYRTTFEYPEREDIWHSEYTKNKPKPTTYKCNAKKQGKIYDLTTEQFAKLIIDACYYCHRTPTTYFGIDKIDSNGDYTADNCVTACASCNWAKWDQTIEDFIARERRITDKYLAGDFKDMPRVDKNASTRRLNTGKSTSGANNLRAKKVYKYALDGSFIRSYDSVSEAAEDVKGDDGSISKCATGYRKSASDFIWRYVYTETVEPYTGSKMNKVYRYALDGSFIRSYDSVSEAAKDIRGNSGHIAACARGDRKTASKFMWSSKPPVDSRIQYD
ncbi:hypothetical protein NY2A_B753L [Paramecium bursaria Chlorella virus NY2A]|uniref:Uncharacterized protein B753L n=1 Tax=Paramecium bursaria Chlorella virus NY2A TaxID=46021 RepID=A7IXS8_PBCVN|nr:hypothetical protein NY2A_B753L [Paramecium bursaria Chlorella virus NY2A]ABT15152.1 hypothetical protein NY2A_B753L [Paramecium bursaria Chlorella virus NY2A]